jgi:hypothetical protein
VFDPKKYCVVCGEEKSTAFMKYCCGHIAGICNKCDNASDRRDIQHRKCNACGGPMSAAEEKAHDEALVDAYEDAMHTYDDMYDDDYLDLDREAEREREREMDEYDRSLQEHISGGSWDFEPEDIGEIAPDKED